MAKAGFWLKGAQGRLAGSSLSSSPNGTIIREIVTPSNPNTERQVNQRSKFKLMSQLASNVADYIAIPRDGGKTPRNQFVSINSPYCISTNGVAQITLDNVQLTKSNVGLPQLEVKRNTGTQVLSVALAEDCSNKWSRICYIVMKKNSEGYLEALSSKVVSDAGENGTFPAELAGAAGNIVVWAYGMKDNNASATVNYGNMQVASADDLAKLIVNRQLTMSDYRFSQTRGVTLLPSVNSAEATPAGSIRVFVTPLGNGTVTGAGTYTTGSSVTVKATAAEGSTFRGWKLQGGNGYVSTDASYTFTAGEQTVDLYADFYTPSSGYQDDSGFSTGG